MQKIINLNSIKKLCGRVFSILIAAALVFLFFTTSHAFESELVPIELNSIIANSTTSVALHRDPSKRSPIIRHFSIIKDEEIFFDQSRTRTIFTGKVIVKKDVYFEGKSFGDISYLSRKQYRAAFPLGEVKLQKYLFKKGDVIDELHRAPEGSSIIRWKKKVLWLDGCVWSCNADDLFQYITKQNYDKPNYEWWIRVTKNGKPQGWLLIDEKTPVDLN